MNLLDKVKQSLKWKQSNQHCATKLNISLEKYKELKKQLTFEFGEKIELLPFSKNKVTEFKENLDEGTAEIKGVSLTEPKTPEEIIEILKIVFSKLTLINLKKILIFSDLNFYLLIP